MFAHCDECPKWQLHFSLLGHIASVDDRANSPPKKAMWKVPPSGLEALSDTQGFQWSSPLIADLFKTLFFWALPPFICLIMPLLLLPSKVARLPDWALLSLPVFLFPLPASNTPSSPSSDPLAQSKPLSLYTLLISLSSRTPRGVLTLGLARE